MIGKSKYEITKELQSAIAAAHAALQRRQRIDDVIARNNEDLKSASHEFEITEAARVSASVDLQIAEGVEERARLTKSLNATEKAVASAAINFKKIQDDIAALHNRVIAADEEVEIQKSLIDVEVGIFTTEIISAFEAELIESLRPFINFLAFGQALNRNLRSSALIDCISNTRIPSLTAYPLSIIGDGGVLIDGSVTSMSDLSHSITEAAALDQQLKPVRDIQSALRAHRPFNPNATVPYARKGYTISRGNVPDRPAPEPAKSTWHPHRRNSAPAAQLEINPAASALDGLQFGEHGGIDATGA